MTFSQEIVSTLSTRFITMGIGILTSILIAHWYGPEGKGLFALLSVITSFAVTWGMLGISSANTYFISSSRELFDKAVVNSFWFGCVSSVFIGGIFFYILNEKPTFLIGRADVSLFMLGLLLIPFMMLQQLFQNILIAIKKIFYLNSFQIIDRLLFLIGLWGIFLFFKTSFFLLFTLTIGVSGVITFLYAIPLFLKLKRNFFNFDLDSFYDSIKYGFRIYCASFLSFILFRSDIYFLNFFKGTTSVGIYSVATGICDMILIIPVVIAFLFFPRVTREKDYKIDLTLRTFRLTIIVTFFLSLCSIPFIKILILFLYGTPFQGAVLPFIILLPGIIAWSGINILIQFFASKGFSWYAVGLWIPGTVLNMLLNSIFIPYFGMVAAAISSTVSYILTFVILIYYFIIKTQTPFFALLPQKKDIGGLVSNFQKMLRI